MKKNTIKAFTLVEMLIVIVIIGILIASLMPRMQTAQGRARDVARKNDLSQIQTAIITSQSDRKEWPGMGNNRTTTTDFPATETANDGIEISKIWEELKAAWMTSVPADPNGSNVTFWLGGTDTSTTAWQYIYVVANRNGVANAWFALMAKTEVEWSSNWVTCANDDGSAKTFTDADDALADGYILSSQDLSEITLCESVSKGAACNASACEYGEEWNLRYILLY